jgi:hypothetical protein
MARKILLRSLTRNDSGATAVEFALVSGVFFFLLFGIIEMGLYMMTSVALEAIVAQAGRATSITSGTSTATGCSTGDRVCVMEAFITQRAQGLINYSPNGFSVVATLVGNPSPPFAGDLCLSSNPPQVGPATCAGAFVDRSNPPNGSYDAKTTNLNSVGGEGDLISIQVVYPWRVINPAFAPFFESDLPGGAGSGVSTIEVGTIVRNES